MSDRAGYLVEYSKKKGFFGDFEPREKLLCSQTTLIDLLRDKGSIIIWSAKWLNVDEYQRNHDNKLEELGFDK